MSTLLTTLTSSVALLLNVLLIVLLVARELLRGTQRPTLQRLRRLFGVACLPLLAVFIATVVIRLSTVADPTAAAQPSSTTVAVVAPPASTVSPIASSSATPTPVASPAASVVPPRAPAATVTTVPPTATAAATATAVGTATSLSTPTVAPSASPTATPSVRPSASPTPAAPPSIVPTTVPSLAPSVSPAPTPTGVVTAARLDIPLSGWPTRDGTTAQLSYADDRYQLVLTGQPSVGVASVLPADNYRVAIDVTLGQGEAGVVFLATEPDTFYRVMINTEGAYAIQSLRNDQVRNVVDWTDSPALNGPLTRLRIERQGTTVQFSANDRPLTTFTVPDGPASNQIGVALASSTGQGQATFSNLVVEKLSAAQ